MIAPRRVRGRAWLTVALIALVSAASYVAYRGLDAQDGAKTVNHSAASASTSAGCTLEPEGGCAPSSNAAQSSSQSPAKVDESATQVDEAAARRALSELPTLEQLSNVSDEDLHSGSHLLDDAGNRLTVITRLAQQGPEGARAARGFYGECADNARLIPSVRAVCVRGLMDLGTEPSAQVSDAIRQLAGRLAPMIRR